MLNLISKYHPKFMIALGSKISGWANTHSSYATITLPETVEEVISIVQQAKQSGKKVLGRGAGRSYGDQSLNYGQILVDMKKINRIIKGDKVAGLLCVQVGATYEEVISYCLKDNWTLAVIPGTRYVTMGGALSNNVHGKNSYARGNFGEWVREFKIVLASGECLTCSKEVNSDLFFSVIGGARLFGIVVEITLQLVRIPSSYLTTRQTTASSLNELLDELDKASQKNDFAIAQVDCFPKTFGLGRGTVSSGSFVSSKQDVRIETMRNISPNIFGVIPKKWISKFGKYFLNDYTMSSISRLKYYIDKNASTKEPLEQNIFQFTFLMDNVPDWNKVFKYGLFEYQPLIPKEKVRAVIPRLIALTHKYGMPAYLSAIKIHKQDNFLISYSMDGYSFAMDIPRRPKKKENQDKLFREMNKIVLEAEGIVYLAKDASLTVNEFKQMYKNLDQFLSLKKKYDPSELFQSDMYRRIFQNNKDENIISNK